MDSYSGRNWIANISAFSVYSASLAIIRFSWLSQLQSMRSVVLPFVDALPMLLLVG